MKLIKKNFKKVELTSTQLTCTSCDFVKYKNRKTLCTCPRPFVGQCVEFSQDLIRFFILKVET